ncbi:hypothetical protein TTHERM_00550940 (macronuclear) [Tetrahymena thermophila SB210]|uniref:Uncharacterized protein n=1 Tax=Tetrahymena thermophila (strain SB210) TaxID=312017 RepID=Q22UN1_TETTS|nr:hypothetical protein TTHERM_00550940 [Tetrahymena thermophila SB210]EAR88939.2 hypothetical protein TTHERM_00550940 [Tetrahymena thermophila SB210]|eukprot:XP_001009184.2 hypothetical protein TTHERM_00550940 [Tetrahymena thermophila SB210]
MHVNYLQDKAIFPSLAQENSEQVRRVVYKWKDNQQDLTARNFRIQVLHHQQLMES